MDNHQTVNFLRTMSSIWPSGKYSDELQIDVWSVVLNDISQETAYNGLKVLSKTCRFNPNPADLMRCIDAAEEQKKQEAAKAWNEVKSNRIIGYSFEEIIDMVPKRTRAVLIEMMKRGILFTEMKLADGDTYTMDNKTGFMNLYYEDFDRNGMNINETKKYLLTYEEK